MKKILVTLLLTLGVNLTAGHLVDYGNTKVLMATDVNLFVGSNNKDKIFTCYSPKGGFYWEDDNLVINRFVCNTGKFYTKEDYKIYKEFENTTWQKYKVVIRKRLIKGNNIGNNDIPTLYFNIIGGKE